MIRLVADVNTMHIPRHAKLAAFVLFRYTPRTPNPSPIHLDPPPRLFYPLFPAFRERNQLSSFQLPVSLFCGVSVCNSPHDGHRSIRPDTSKPPSSLHPRLLLGSFSYPLLALSTPFPISPGPLRRWPKLLRAEEPAWPRWIRLGRPQRR